MWVALVRASFEKRSDPLKQFPAQKYTLTNWERHTGNVIGYTHPEITSCSKPLVKRPDLAVLLPMLATGNWDGIVLPNMERLCRRMHDLCDLERMAEKGKWAIAWADWPTFDWANPSDRLAMQVRMATAEFHSRQTGVLATNSAAQKRSVGKLPGRKIEFSQKTADIIGKNRAAGVSIAEIVRILKDAGERKIKVTKGEPDELQPFTRRHVESIIKRMSFLASIPSTSIAVDTDMKARVDAVFKP